MVSDMTDAATVDATLHYGEPFLPFEQLLAVLPSASHKLLPAPFKVGQPTTLYAYFHTRFHRQAE